MNKWQETIIGRLPADWSIQTLLDVTPPKKKMIISGPFGSNIGRKYFVDSGVPVIRGNNLNLDIGSKFNDEGFVFITEEKADALNTYAATDDLVFTAAGTIGQVGLITDEQKYPRYIISNKQQRVTLDQAKIDPYFAYYWFASNFMQQWIINCNTGSTVPLINLTVLKSLPVPVPPLEEQQAITAVLASLDDKIDLLHRQNKTLESIAQTLFRHWFIDEAVEYVELPELVEINPSLRLKKGTVAPYLEMKNVQTDSCAPIDWYDREFNSGTRFQNGDTLMARITPCLENNKVSYVNFLNGDEVGWGSTEYLVLRAKANLPRFYTYLLAKNSDFRAFAIKTMTGSSGRQRVQTESLYGYELGIPSTENLQLFNNQIDPIEQKLKSNSNQIRTLEKLRDTLLPKLMSGEVRVRL